MSDDFLSKIGKEKLEELKGKQAYYENLKKNLKPQHKSRYEIFKKAISRPGQINLIAEIKKSSPSAGLIREDFDIAKIAKTYVDHHASAISVLTEERYFLGKLAYLKKVSDEFNVPTLMKDFIVHEYQIYDGALNGASAVLLIVAMLSDSQLKEYMHLAEGLGMDCLIEVHDEAEVERALRADAQIIGVNNRNLRTLEVDLNNCLRMIKLIPPGHVIVAESGLKTRDDIKKVQDIGAHAVLIGETFMRSADIGKKIEEMFG